MTFLVYGSEESQTLLPGLVENLDVFELHADAGPELHGIRGVVFAASLYRTICMCPSKKKIRKIKSLKETGVQLLWKANMVKHHLILVLGL